jgi:hypothetical protein
MADQPFASFEVCVRCYELHGPFDHAWKGTQYRFVQECRCEREARPDGERQPTWMSFDFNDGAELCYGCGAELLRSGSRFSVWFCGPCKARVAECNRAAGVAVVPIGRHSFMHGFGLSGASAPPGEIDAFVARLGNLFDRIQLLDGWSREVVRRNLADTGFLDPEAPVALPRYLVAVANVDRDERFATMLEWMTDHDREQPRAAFGAAASCRLADGLEQLEVELDLHYVTERDNTDTRRQRDVDAVVLAADFGRGLEAGVAGATRERLDSAELDGEHDGTGNVADG